MAVTVTVDTENEHPLDFVVSEANGARSRDEITIDSTQNTVVKAGTVLGKITGGNWVEYDDGNLDGSEVAAGVLAYEVDNTAGANVEAVAIVRDAEVFEDKLVFKATVDEAQAKDIDLPGKGIIVRTGV